jgi:hypothetical protein
MEKKIATDCHQEFLRVARSNFESIKSYADKSIAQLQENEFYICLGAESNSVGILMQHISGNLVSRFTDFLSSDGEKQNRNRDSEFEDNGLSKKELIDKWEAAWKILFDLLASLSETHLTRTIVYVRNEPHSVMEAINRQVWHYAFHVGQIVALAKEIKGEEWKNLSIPKKIK